MESAGFSHFVLPVEAIEKDDLYYVANNMKNLLENVTLRKHNVLIRIKEEMNRYGAVGSMMSGSGPSVFAFFDDMLKAQRCYEKMKENHREVFLTRTIYKIKYYNEMN